MDFLRKTTLLVLILSVLGIGSVNASSAISRDSCMSIASTYCYAVWTVNSGNSNSSPNPNNGNSPYNDYTVGEIVTGIDYEWGGYDTLSSCLAKLFAGATAGDSYDAVYYPSNYWTGVDCSGYASRCWVSGHYVTSTFASICSTLSYPDLYMGDLTDYSGSHCRLFDYFNPGNNYLMSYEATAGVDPKRVTHRIFPQDNHFVPMRYLKITPFNPPVNVRQWPFYN